MSTFKAGDAVDWNFEQPSEKERDEVTRLKASYGIGPFQVVGVAHPPGLPPALVVRGVGGNLVFSSTRFKLGIPAG